MSDAISTLLLMSSQLGLTASEGKWSNALVYWIDAPMPNEIRAAGTATSDLNYFKTERTPHNPGTEGYTDRASQRAITFLVGNK